MATWFKGLSGWNKAIISLTGGLIIGSFTYLLLHRRDKKIAHDKKAPGDGGNREMSRRVLVLGLSGSGKSSILCRSKFEAERMEIKPTEGFNVICLQKPNMVLNIWEIGGSDAVKPYWPNFLKDTDLLVYVVDSEDKEHMEEAELEFRKLLDEEKLNGVSVLLLANKQDLPGAMSPFEMEKQFGCVKGRIQDHLVRTIGTIAAAFLPPHPSIWEAERLMISMTTKKQATPC